MQASMHVRSDAGKFSAGLNTLSLSLSVINGDYREKTRIGDLVSRASKTRDLVPPGLETKGRTREVENAFFKI